MPLKIYGYQKPIPDYWAKSFETDTSFHKPDEFYLSIFLEYIRRNARILDGDCGLGYTVSYMSSLGYDAIGIDFSKTLIKRARFLKNTSLHVGDITRLPYKENTFDTYISEGVFEHFEEGPQLPLAEANRVLKRGGNLIITVPYYNPFRKMKNFFLAHYHYWGQSDRKGFFEYAFTKKEIEKHIEGAGFKLVKSVPISPLETLKLEVPGYEVIIDTLLRNFLKSEDNSARKTTTVVNVKKSVWRTTLLNLLKKSVRSKIFRYIFSHMILVIAENARAEHLPEKA
jgi:SAM-dependent methyltransferase